MPTHLARPLLAFVLALSAVASATVIVHETLDELARRVPVIVRARVARSVTAWDDQKRSISTWTELTVIEAIKGKPGALVLVTQPGGEIDGIGQAVAGVAKFREGEECVLFLEPSPRDPTSFMVSGFSAGKIVLTELQGLPTAVRDTSGLMFARPAKGPVAEPVRSPELLGSPEDFIKRIRKAMGGAR